MGVHNNILLAFTLFHVYHTHFLTTMVLPFSTGTRRTMRRHLYKTTA